MLHFFEPKKGGLKGRNAMQCGIIRSKSLSSVMLLLNVKNIPNNFESRLDVKRA